MLSMRAAERALKLADMAVKARYSDGFHHLLMMTTAEAIREAEHAACLRGMEAAAKIAENLHWLLQPLSQAALNEATDDAAFAVCTQVAVVIREKAGKPNGWATTIMEARQHEANEPKGNGQNRSDGRDVRTNHARNIDLSPCVS